MQVTTIGLDIAKNVFQVHGVSQDGDVVVRRAIRRAQVLAFFSRLAPCLVGIEASCSAHHWARTLISMGHDVRLIPPAYVKPYAKRGKSDAIDAEAICEAVTRPTMRFVPVKTPDQQALLALHRGRDLLVRQRTQLVNALRGILAEFGIVLGQGIGRALELVRQVLADAGPDVPDVAKEVICGLSTHILSLTSSIKACDIRLHRIARKDERVRRLLAIPGVGPVTASAIVATIGDAGQFRSGRDFAAWLGLTPANRSSGGKERLGRITKMGDRYLRRLLVVGMTSVVRQTRNRPERADPWLVALLDRKPTRLATVAMANKTARIIWALLARDEPYAPRHA